MADNTITTELDLDASKAEKKLKQFENTAGDSGKKTASNYSSGFKVGLGALTATIAGVAGALGALFSAKAAIKASSEQQDAINRLNQSLASTGKFSKEASADLQTFASQLQQNSKFGDEVILSNAALIQSLGNLDTQGLKRATQASADLATALGVDLTTASALVGKAASGNVGVLSRYGIQVEKGANQTETFANALRAIEQRFGGSALSATQTFSGSLQGLQNTFGDVLEVLGDVVTKSPALVAVFNVIKTTLQQAGQAFGDLTKGEDVLGNIIKKVIEFSIFFNQFFVRPVEIGVQIINVALDSIVTGIQAVFTGLVTGASAVANGLAKLGIGEGIAEELNVLAESSQETLGEFVTNTNESLAAIGDDTVTSGINGFLENIQNAVNTAKPLVEEFKNSIAGPETAEQISASNQAIGTSFESLVTSFGEQAKKIQVTNGDIAKSFTNTFARGIGNAFSAVGQAFVKGENAFAAFGKVVLGLFADLAIQLGQGFILQGVARQLAGDPGGGALIAAGAALATFGGALKALAGGGGGLGGSTATTGAAGGAPTPGSPLDQANQPNPVNAEARTAVNLTVNGSIFDSPETGSRILGLLNENFDTTGATLSSNASFA